MRMHHDSTAVKPFAPDCSRAWWLLGTALLASTVSAQNIGSELLLRDHLKRLEQAAPASKPPVDGLPSAPAAVAPKGEGTVYIQEIQFSSSELLDTPSLQAVAAPYAGKSLNTTDIQKLLNEVGELYKSRGILTALPVLPRQDLRSGILRILLVEGRLGQVKIEGETRAGSGWVQQWFDLPAGEVITSEAVRERLVRFNYSSDFTAATDLVAGEQFGQTHLMVKVQDPQALQAWGYYETSSAPKSTNPGQLVAGMRLTPLSAYGGRFDASVLRTDLGQTVTGAIGLPLGTTGWRSTLSAARTRSEGVAAVPITSESTSVSWDVGRTWALNAPWVLGTALNLSRYQSTTYLDDPLKSRTDRAGLVVTFNHDVPGQRGLLRSGLYFGSGANRYRYLENTGQWLSTLDDKELWQLRASALLRVLPQDMPSTFDRFYLGGIDTVRGYDLGSASGNQGAAMQLEVRRRINGLSDQPAEVYAFVDSGHVRAPELSKTLYSVGAGTQWRLNQHLALDLMLTRQLSSHALAQAQATNRAIMRLVASY